MSSSRTGMPAFDRCAATCAPIVPAPSTAAVRMAGGRWPSPLMSAAPRPANPPTRRSTIWSASATSEYLRRLRIQLVAISSSAPNNSLAANVGLTSLRNTPAALAVDDGVADDAEVVAQLGGREPLHELGRGSQLDLEDHRERAVAAQPIQVQAGNLAEPLDRMRRVRRCCGGPRRSPPASCARRSRPAGRPCRGSTDRPVPAATPAARAMSATWALKKPRAAKVSMAARRIASRLSPRSSRGARGTGPPDARAGHE